MHAAGFSDEQKTVHKPGNSSQQVYLLFSETSLKWHCRIVRFVQDE